MSESTKAHWDAVYGRRGLDEVSWYETRPTKSLELIRASGVRPEDPIIDVGGGGSFLVDELLNRGYRDLTVLDISSEVLQKLRARLGDRVEHVTLLQDDVTAFRPKRRYALWHDRAVFHFLVDADDRARYVDALESSLRPEAHVIVATFGPAGPERCSGLPTMRYSAQSLARTLGDDFSLVESSLEDHRTPSAASQQFLFTRFHYESHGHEPDASGQHR